MGDGVQTAMEWQAKLENLRDKEEIRELVMEQEQVYPKNPAEAFLSYHVLLGLSKALLAMVGEEES